MEPESESSAIPQPTMPRQPLRTLQRTAPLNGVAGRSNHPGSRSDADHAGEENARGGSLRAFAAPFLRVASTVARVSLQMTGRRAWSPSRMRSVS